MVTFRNPVEVTVTPRGGSGWLPAVVLVVVVVVLTRAGVVVAHQAGVVLRDAAWFAAALLFSGTLARCGLAFSRWEQRREAGQVAEPVRWRSGERMLDARRQEEQGRAGDREADAGAAADRRVAMAPGRVRVPEVQACPRGQG